MRTVVCTQWGPPELLEIRDVPSLEAAPGTVVIDVEAAGVNFVDALFVQGTYQIKIPPPFTPGGEVAGRVSAVGAGVERVRVGDRVMAMTGLGAFAEQVAVGEQSVVVLPDGFDAQRAAAFIQSYCTVEFALTQRTQVRAGERVLVLGAGGGIGLAAIDVAKSLGALVIAAASSADKLEAARVAGADETVSYDDEDLKARARELSAGGVDVVIDPVGGPHADAALRATGVGGRYVVIGFASGTIPSIKANLVLLNNRTIVGVDWGAWSSKHREENAAMLTGLVRRVAEGKLHPPAPTAFPLASAGQVLTDALDRRLAGKAVLVP